MEKSALAGEGGGVTAHPSVTLFTITYKVAVYAPSEGGGDTYTPSISDLPYMYSVREAL